MLFQHRRIEHATAEGQKPHEPMLVDYARSFFPVILAVLRFRTFLIEPFRIPSGIEMVRINPTTGALARPDEKNAIYEAYKPGTEPGSSNSGVVVGGNVPAASGLGIDTSDPDGAATVQQQVPTTGTGGLY